MFRLYGEIAGRKLLDKSNDEKDIIETITEYISQDSELRFLIIKETSEGDEIYRSIRSFQSYLDYLEEYNLRQESIIQLKEEILDLAGQESSRKR